MAKKPRALWRDAKKVRALKIVAAAADLWRLAECKYPAVRHRASAIVVLMVKEAKRLGVELEEWEALTGDERAALERDRAIERARAALEPAFAMGAKPTQEEQVNILRNADRTDVARDVLKIEAKVRLET